MKRGRRSRTKSEPNGLGRFTKKKNPKLWTAIFLFIPNDHPGYWQKEYHGFRYNELIEGSYDLDGDRTTL
jgi:hypothetical protein